MLDVSSQGRTITVTVSICNSIPGLVLSVTIDSNDGTLSPNPVDVSACVLRDGLLYICTVEIEAQSSDTTYTLTATLTVNMMIVGSQISREITTDLDCMLKIAVAVKITIITFCTCSSLQSKSICLYWNSNSCLYCCDWLCCGTSSHNNCYQEEKKRLFVILC